MGLKAIEKKLSKLSYSYSAYLLNLSIDSFIHQNIYGAKMPTKKNKKDF